LAEADEINGFGVLNIEAAEDGGCQGCGRMRLSPLAVIFVTAGFVAVGCGTRANAQNYPWCLQSSAYEGGENCGFTTHEQCMATRLGIGGFCQMNTQYRASALPASSPRRIVKAHSGRPS
jgi:hypothetical protein